MPETNDMASRIVIDPAIMLGKPTVRGTRITVEHILRMFGAGYDDDAILDCHPHLSVEDLRAAQIFAADSLGHWRVLAAE